MIGNTATRDEGDALQTWPRRHDRRWERVMTGNGTPRDLPRVVHLELHTNDQAGASAFYAALLGWRTERIDNRWGSYHALALGGGQGGGIVECGTPRAGWLPYAEVEEIGAATERAQALGGRVLVVPREGPAGWRSVIATPAAGEIALWQQKR